MMWELAKPRVKSAVVNHHWTVGRQDPGTVLHGGAGSYPYPIPRGEGHMYLPGGLVFLALVLLLALALSLAKQ
jgi:hypothetical protein